MVNSLKFEVVDSGRPNAAVPFVFIFAEAWGKAQMEAQEPLRKIRSQARQLSVLALLETPTANHLPPCCGRRRAIGSLNDPTAPPRRSQSLRPW